MARHTTEVNTKVDRKGQWRARGCVPALFFMLAATVALAWPPPGWGAQEHNCRFWACAADGIPVFVITDHLATLPNSIEHLSPGNPSGWGVAFYSDGAAPTIRRGAPAAYLDPQFDVAVAEAAAASAWVAVSHIRACSSGLCNIPNPHPFARQKNGKHWLMGHNGTISKETLLDLIRPEFFEANPPQYGTTYPEWIDSDLYFIYILQTLEDFGWDIKRGLGEVVERLRAAIPGDEEELNFFLTDGNAIWAYREGRSLYYLYEPQGTRQRAFTPLRCGPDGNPEPVEQTSTAGDLRTADRPALAMGEPASPARPRQCGTPYSAVASQYPSAAQGNWIEIEEGQIITLAPTQPPTVEDIEIYF